MLMPKAAVYKDRFASAREHNIRFAREILAVQPESVALSMQKRPQQHFRLCVFTADPAHVLAAPMRVEFVHTY